MGFDLDTYRPRILDILHTHRDVLPLRGSLAEVEITTLGIGESNLMLHIALEGQAPLTMRLAYRADLADRLLPREFRLLQRLPENLGPRAFVLDMSRAVLPYPFAILSFVPGTPLVDCSEEILRIHARKIARLHQDEASTWTTGDGEQSSEPFDLYQRFLRKVAFWRAEEPRIFEEEPRCQLLPRLDAYFRERNHLFTALTCFQLVHHDLCASNILVHEGDVCYIDWEYGCYGDGAVDFAQMAWDMDNPPWHIKLDEWQLNVLFQTYLELRPDPTLIERYKVWCVYIKFFDHLGHRGTALYPNAIQSFPGSYYERASQRLLTSLVNQFL
ncbi:MAG TPA: aminoglycoside phosphotransferase family protein [Ktedonobacteraceae bacterium]